MVHPVMQDVRKSSWEKNLEVTFGILSLSIPKIKVLQKKYSNNLSYFGSV